MSWGGEVWGVPPSHSLDSSPRFDVTLVLTDARNPSWDRAVSQHVLAAHQKV